MHERRRRARAVGGGRGSAGDGGGGGGAAAAVAIFRGSAPSATSDAIADACGAGGHGGASSGGHSEECRELCAPGTHTLAAPGCVVRVNVRDAAQLVVPGSELLQPSHAAA